VGWAITDESFDGLMKGDMSDVKKNSKGMPWLTGTLALVILTLLVMSFMEQKSEVVDAANLTGLPEEAALAEASAGKPEGHDPLTISPSELKRHAPLIESQYPLPEAKWSKVIYYGRGVNSVYVFIEAGQVVAVRVIPL
jgi:hypothetical protein